MGTDARTRRARATHLVHFEQRALLHLLERAHLTRVRLACKEDLAVATLAYLGDDLELVDLELDTAFAEEGAFPAAIRLELLGVFGLSEVPLGGVLVEACSPLFPCRDVAKELKVVVKKVYPTIYSVKHDRRRGRWIGYGVMIMGRN